MSGERCGTQPPQDEWPAAPQIAGGGGSSRDKDGHIGGNEKDNHWWTTEMKALSSYPFQAMMKGKLVFLAKILFLNEI